MRLKFSQQGQSTQLVNISVNISQHEIEFSFTYERLDCWPPSQQAFVDYTLYKSSQQVNI